MRPAPALTRLPRYPITGGIGILAIAVTAATWVGKDLSLLWPTAMIRRGELWRLVTAIFPHADVLHLAFNVYWLWVFGTLVEEVFGRAKTAALILLFALGSSAFEFAFSRGGIGLSGVVYGLFGLLWVLSKYDERFRDAVDDQTIAVFVVWFFICIGGTLMNAMNVGNIAHGTGAVLGILAAFSIVRANRRPAIVAGIAVIVCFALCASTFWRPVLNAADGEGYEEGRWGYDALVANQNGEAIRWLRDATRYQPKVPEFWYYLALAQERSNDKLAAADGYRHAAELGDGLAQCHLAHLYRDGTAGLSRDTAQALHWYREASAHESPFALNCVAWAYATSTDPAIRNPVAALQHARKAVQLSEKPEPAFLDTLAEAYFLNGQIAEAVKTAEQAIAAGPENRTEYEKRLEHFRRALQNQSAPASRR
jgi:membrane associated rhomboid family serine protease/TPR repeat protein